MSTEKQIEANRRNAQNSTGPKTADGKSKVAVNALRHGLTGRVILLSADDQKAYTLHMEGYMKRFNPQDAVERDLAESIATGMWRLKGASAIEQNLFTDGYHDFSKTLDVHCASHEPQIIAALSDAKTFADQAHKFQLLTLYEQRLQRAVDRNIATLRQLQAERKAERDQALAEEELLAQLSYAEGQPYQPETTPEGQPVRQNGFVFSTAQINASIVRKRRLGIANQARNHAWDLTKMTRAAQPALLEPPPMTLPSAA